MEPREPSSFSMREFQRAALPSHVDAIRASLQKLAQAERVILLQERQRSLDSKVLEHYAKHYGVYGGEQVEFQVQPPYTVDSPEAMNEYVEKLRQHCHRINQKWQSRFGGRI